MPQFSVRTPYGNVRLVTLLVPFFLLRPPTLRHSRRLFHRMHAPSKFTNRWLGRRYIGDDVLYAAHLFCRLERLMPDIIDGTCELTWTLR